MKILITGASSGLGEEMARQFAGLGHDLVLAARRTARLEKLQKEILDRNPGISVSIETLDVLDSDEVFRIFQSHAPLDRVIVNAGMGSGKPVGTGGHEYNRQLATTNFIASLTQIEAAMEQFRRQQRGHLVIISSFTAMRGLRGGQAGYGATKRGLAYLGEALRSETFGTDIKITVIYPGYIRSEMTAGLANTPFMVDLTTGVKKMVKGIEKYKAEFFAPYFPWTPLSWLIKILPLRIVSKVVKPPRGE